MELKQTDLEANETIAQVIDYLHISITNLTNSSQETQIKLFDLFEAYRTREKEQLGVYKFVAYVIGTLIILSNLTVVISSGLILKKGNNNTNFKTINISYLVLSSGKNNCSPFFQWIKIIS